MGATTDSVTHCVGECILVCFCICNFLSRDGYRDQIVTMRALAAQKKKGPAAQAWSAAGVQKEKLLNFPPENNDFSRQGAGVWSM